MHIDSMPDDCYIFQSIDECEALIPNDQSEVKIERYATPNADKDLKDIPYESFFGMQFKSDEMKYQIFAYEFEDFESALKYFVNASGTSYSYEEDRATIEQYDYALYFVAKNPLSCHFVVISQNNVYQLRAPNRYFDEIYAVLKDIFSKQVTMLRWFVLTDFQSLPREWLFFLSTCKFYQNVL